MIDYSSPVQTFMIF